MEIEISHNIGMGMGKHGNRLHGSEKEWDYEKSFPAISSPAIQRS